MWVNIAVALIGAVSGSGLTGLVLAVMQRKWKKQDEAEAGNTVSREEYEALKADVGNVRLAIRASLEQNIRNLAMCYIAAGEISFDDKETFHNMHTAYKRNGGEDLEVVLEEVDKLKVTEPRFKRGESA